MMGAPNRSEIFTEAVSFVYYSALWNESQIKYNELSIQWLYQEWDCYQYKRRC
jgi:hypothetical protein